MAIAARPAKSAISQSNLIASSALAGNTDAWKQSARAHPWGVCGPPPMPDLIRRAKKREAKAVDVLDMVVRAIGDTIQILAQSVDPRLIILGGGMAKTGEPLVEVITAELRRRESQCRFLETLDLPARLRLAPVGQPVGAIGAAMAA